MASSFLSFYLSKPLFINFVADPDCPVDGGQGSCVGRRASQQLVAGSTVAGKQLDPTGAEGKNKFRRKRRNQGNQQGTQSYMTMHLFEMIVLLKSIRCVGTRF